MTSSLRNYLLGIFIASILCWAALILIIFNSNPYSGGKSIIILFFISLFFGSVGFYLRLLFSKNEIIYSHIVPSIRQAFLMSFCVVVLLALQILRLVNIWTGILLVLAVLSLEFFFRTRLRKVKKL